MADVNFFDAFGYKWALVGPAENLQDDQYKLGWGFIGAVPPSVEEFNRVHQVADEKANYLFGLINAAVVGSGGALNAGSVNALRDAMTGRNLGGVVITNSASVVVPARATRAWVRIWGAGGGGGGNGNAGVGGGGGGGGGAYWEGFLPVTGGGTIVATIGVGGVGGAPGGNTGNNGTASSFGGLAAAGGGVAGTGVAAGAGIGGVGGSVSAAANELGIGGSGGQNGIQLAPGADYIGGSGGGTYYSGNSLHGIAAGVGGTFPGGGGGGSGRNNAGGPGANGLILAQWLS